jgi:crotonobetainyl-CoA:carnitine CoA-transferase CaiB-like acyl-CoA transferase
MTTHKPSEPPSGSLLGPLSGIKILDLTSVVLGPFATHILSSLGAQVIKIETEDGDTMRHVGPMNSAGMGHIFMHANSNKQSVVLDLKSPDGLEAALRLASSCDVMISNVRPAAMARLGLDFESVKKRSPRIIYVSCCGFDQDGPYATKPAYDDLIQGAVGVPWLMKQYGAPEPCYAPVTLADRVTGLHAVYAVTTALFERERFERENPNKKWGGTAVVVPMFEALTQFVLGDHLAGASYEPPIGAAGYARLLTPHRKPYKTSDGYLCVLIYNDKHWQSFFSSVPEAITLKTDPRFVTHTARADNIDAVYAEVSRLMQTRTTSQWRTLLELADIPNMPINSPDDLLNDPHHAATGFIQTFEHPTEGTMRMVSNPTQWSNHPKLAKPQPAPHLGQHTREVLSQLGYDDATITRMMAQTHPK